MPRLVKGSQAAKDAMEKARAAKRAGPRTQKQDADMRDRLAKARAAKKAKRAAASM